jgi:hypothetical protein
VLSIHIRLRQDIPAAIRTFLGKSIAKIAVNENLISEASASFFPQFSDIPINQFFLHDTLIHCLILGFFNIK